MNEYTFGPWLSAPDECDAGCEIETDAAGHRRFRVWTLDCPIHAVFDEIES